jgi:glyoxylase-like metal-dependent hydrolase (beta-lactamase superfamily II)
MTTLSFSVGPLNTNCYLLISDADSQCLVIDPGGSAEMLASEIQRRNLKPQAIIATHGHFDHILAAHELQLAFKIPFMVQKNDQFLVKELQARAQHWISHQIIEQSPTISSFLQAEQKIALGQEELQVILSPGHTPGGVCLVNEQEQLIFTGDTIFADGVGRTDLSYSSARDLKKSIANLRQNFAGYLAYPGHGKQFYFFRQTR